MATRRGHIGNLRNTQPLSYSFIRTKNEGLVSDDRQSGRPSEVILLELWQASRSPVGVCACRGRGVEEVARIERTIAQIFEEAAVKIIGSTLRDDNGLASHRRSVFRRKETRHDPVFSNPFDAQRIVGYRRRIPAVDSLHDR